MDFKYFEGTVSEQETLKNETIKNEGQGFLQLHVKCTVFINLN